jgi:hypothetical protein
MKINLIDYYNQNYSNRAIQLIFEADRTIKEVKKNKFGVVLNHGKEDAFMEYKEGYFEITDDNPLGLEKGIKYSAFDITCKLKYKGKFFMCYYDLAWEFFKTEVPFIRVGINYFKKVEVMDIDGIIRQKLMPWNKMEIKEDLGKEAMSRIKKFDGFVMRPDNVNFKQEIGGFYNIYQPFAHKPEKCSNFEKDCPWSHKMLRHVFGEQYGLGLIYMQVLYLHPMQTLPILGLVSRENQTGKSTFANWITLIFGANSSIIDINSFGSDFTEAFAERNIVVIEETKSKDEKIMNKLKALSTQKKLLVNKKNISMYDTDFFCKFIINSNHENNFLRIDREDIRYWVRKLPKLSRENANHNIEEDLLNEVPKFLGYLQKLPKIDFSRSRMVFTEEEIRTEQLDRVKESSKTALYSDIKQRAEDFLADHPDFECLDFSITDMKDFWYKHNSRYDSKYIKKTLEEEMNLRKSEKRQRYRSMINEGSTAKDKTGFFYTITRDQFPDWDLMDGYTATVNSEVPF